MATPAGDKQFTGSIPEIYDSFLVPLLFAPFAQDLARRVAARNPSDVLEIAAGTGAVTRALDRTLPPSVRIVATDLNAPMIERARTAPASRDIEWGTADALDLPMEPGSFDAVVCQFGVMFVPDKPRAFAEARRVLRPGGALCFNAWDGIERSVFAHEVEATLATLFPSDPPRFMRRTPHGYADVRTIRRDLAAAGFAAPADVETVTLTSRAPSAHHVAVAYCQGTPWRGEITARDATRLDEVTAAVTAALERRFGTGPIEGPMAAHVVVVTAS